MKIRPTFSVNKNGAGLTQQIRDVGRILAQCLFTVCDVGPTLSRRQRLVFATGKRLRFEAVSRCRDPRHQVGENYSDLTKWT